MANNASNIVVGASGRVLVAPVGTTAPAHESDAFPAGWVELGYLNEDGVQPSPSVDVNGIPVWQEFYDVRKIVTGRTLDFEITLAEWTKTNVILAFGGGTVTTLSAGHYKYSPPAASVLDERAFAVEWADGSKQYRWIVYRGIVTDLGKTQVQRSDAAWLPITFSMLATGSTTPFDIFSNDAAWA